MTPSFRSDLKNLRRSLTDYFSEIVIVSSATLFMILNEYNPIRNFWISSVVYFVLCPLATILIVLRKNPMDFGQNREC